MTIDTSRLRAKWGWSALLSLVPFAVMGWIDSIIKAATDYGVLHLQFAGTADKTAEILGAWTAAGVAPHVAFSLGLDYLFMPLFGAAFFFAALVAREAYPGQRGLFSLLAWAGPVAALLDALENAIHAGMVMGMTGPGAVAIQYPATLAKWALVAVGLLVSIVALTGLRRLKRAD